MVILIGIWYYFLSAYSIKTVYVEGNIHYTQEEIKDIVMEGKLGSNSLYLSLKYKNKGVEGIPFVDIMDVSILSPDTIKIKVYEKALAGYIEFMDRYMYFDKDGYVVESANVKTVGIPQITGLSFEYVILGEKLPIKNDIIFEQIMDITKLLTKYELIVDKIYFQSESDINLYFGNIRVLLGDSKGLEEKIMILPKFLSELEGKCGTIKMDNYLTNSSIIGFEPDER